MTKEQKKWLKLCNTLGFFLCFIFPWSELKKRNNKKDLEVRNDKRAKGLVEIM